MFKTFPEFSRLRLEDKKSYEALIKDYPPLADLSFVMLMTWWNSLDTMAISLLNGNVVFSYLIPGDDNSSGIGFAGTEKVDESICTIMDYLREKGELARLVHVPEFVIAKMRYPEIFRFTEERDYDECVVNVKELNQTLNSNNIQRPGLDRLMSAKIETRLLDLRASENRFLLLEAHKRWLKKGSINDTVKLANEFVPMIINRSQSFDIHNLCLFVEGHLQGFMLYQKPRDKRYIIMDTFKVNPARPYLFDLAVYMFTRKFAEDGVELANIDIDLGLPILRNAKLKLGPTNFFRKYTIEPV